MNQIINSLLNPKDNGIKVLKKKMQKNWSREQKAKLFVFAKENPQINEYSESCLWNKYLKMAKFIKTKNHRQCKHYHNILLKLYNKIDKVIEKYLQFQPQIFPLMQKYVEIYHYLVQEEKKNCLLTESEKEVSDKVQKECSNDNSQSEKKNDNPTNDSYANEQPFQNYESQNKTEKSLNQWQKCNTLFQEWYSQMSKLLSQ